MIYNGVIMGLYYFNFLFTPFIFYKDIEIQNKANKNVIKYIILFFSKIS